MRRLLTAVLATLGLQVALAVPQLKTPKLEPIKPLGPPSAWAPMFETSTALYELSVASVALDVEAVAASFVVRVTFRNDVDGIKYIVESAIVLCKSGTYVSAAQLQHDREMRLLRTIAVPKAYENPNDITNPLTHVFFCVPGKYEEGPPPTIKLPSPKTKAGGV